MTGTTIIEVDATYEHTGTGPGTCDRDSTVLTISLYDKMLESVLGKYPNSAWTEKQFRMVEAKLMTCPCGGTFKLDAKPKCPNCGAISFF